MRVCAPPGVGFAGWERIEGGILGPAGGEGGGVTTRDSGDDEWV